NAQPEVMRYIHDGRTLDRAETAERRPAPVRRTGSPGTGRQLTGLPSGHREARALLWLAVTLVAGLLAFALADLVVARTWPSEFEGIQTRIDALYFALATLTTIGYGDVSAQGQIARAFVCAQMVFSVGVLASGVPVLIRQVLRPKS
ncbi:potassium channel family protein, partial [Micromonospora musae]|uniref:potassium channel family protein n=1 Tax=Micromonospora musae TaxID=1894970 RepID=UPI00340F6605